MTPSSQKNLSLSCQTTNDLDWVEKSGGLFFLFGMLYLEKSIYLLF